MRCGDVAGFPARVVNLKFLESTWHPRLGTSNSRTTRESIDASVAFHERCGKRDSRVRLFRRGAGRKAGPGAPDLFLGGTALRSHERSDVRGRPPPVEGSVRRLAQSATRHG